MNVTFGIENAVYVARTIATLGSYDGIHLGHRDILNTLLTQQEQFEFSRSIVLTFDPHPQEVLKKNNTSIKLLTTLEERLDILRHTDIDEVVVIAFTKEFSQTPYSEFFKEILVGKLGIAAMVVGSNHAFGKNREGDVKHLESLAKETGVMVTEVPPHLIDGVHISSTKIRAAIAEGNIETVTKYLGRPYQLRGTVVNGDKIGRTLGYPTINLEVPSNKLLPKDGIYSGKATLQDGRTFTAAISVGARPTITDSSERLVEAFLLDFDEEVYRETVTLAFNNYLREQIKFDSLPALQYQIEADIALIIAGTAHLQ